MAKADKSWVPIPLSMDVLEPPLSLSNLDDMSTHSFYLLMKV